MTIRNAFPADEAEVVTLWRRCNLVAPYNDPSWDFQFARDKPNSDILVAEKSGAIVGSVMVGHDGHRGWLYYVAVSADHRKQGLGQALVRAAEAWLGNRGVRKAQLMVRETNTEVAAFYARIGYEPMPRTNFEKWLKR